MSTVETSTGRLAGRVSDDGSVFLGVPYAAAPRWAPPATAPAWTGTRDATHVGPAAPQPAREVARFTHGELPGTDETGCLSLNVFAPRLDGRRPVLVWIHGGGFTIGHGGASLYDGGWFAARADVVVVTINYRLGSLGWLGHPSLAAGPGAPFANWGLLDQIVALRWVREHIGAFGGDPARVTLAGQSAGALAVMDLLAAPAAEGLFSRAILQSPVMGDVGQRAEPAVAWAEALAHAAGLSSGPAGLRDLEADRLVALHEELLGDPAFRGTRGGALPTVDSLILPVSPAERPHASPDVDVLAGHNADEGTFFFRSPWRPAPPPERIPGVIAHLTHSDNPDGLLSERRAAAEQANRPADDLSLLVDLATDAMVAAPLSAWASARAGALSGRSCVYRYRVDHPGAGAELRATHTTEVPLLFGTWEDGGPGQRLGGQAAAATTASVGAELADAWARFIHDAQPGWDPLDRDPAAVRLFGDRHVRR